MGTLELDVGTRTISKVNSFSNVCTAFGFSFFFLIIIYIIVFLLFGIKSVFQRLYYSLRLATYFLTHSNQFVNDSLMDSNPAPTWIYCPYWERIEKRTETYSTRLIKAKRVQTFDFNWRRNGSGELSSTDGNWIELISRFDLDVIRAAWN